jgi:hypothetical protein
MMFDIAGFTIRHLVRELPLDKFVESYLETTRTSSA